MGDVPQPLMFSGAAFVDGSSMGWAGPWSTCGWAAVVRDDEEAATTFILYGPMPAELPCHKTIQRAELNAFQQALE